MQKKEDELKFDISVKWGEDIDGFSMGYVGVFSNEIPKKLPYIDRKTGLLHISGKEVEACTPVNPRLFGHEHRYWVSPDIDYEDSEEDVLNSFHKCRGLQIGNWHYEFCLVTVSLFGVELGLASIGGVESDSSEEFRKDILNDCKIEALGEAVETLRKIIKLSDIDITKLYNKEVYSE